MSFTRNAPWLKGHFSGENFIEVTRSVLDGTPNNYLHRINGVGQGERGAQPLVWQLCWESSTK